MFKKKTKKIIAGCVSVGMLLFNNISYAGFFDAAFNGFASSSSSTVGSFGVGSLESAILKPDYIGQATQKAIQDVATKAATSAATSVFTNMAKGMGTDLALQFIGSQLPGIPMGGTTKFTPAMSRNVQILCQTDNSSPEIYSSAKYTCSCLPIAANTYCQGDTGGPMSSQTVEFSEGGGHTEDFGFTYYTWHPGTPGWMEIGSVSTTVSTEVYDGTNGMNNDRGIGGCIGPNCVNNQQYTTCVGDDCNNNNNNNTWQWCYGDDCDNNNNNNNNNDNKNTNNPPVLCYGDDCATGGGGACSGNDCTPTSQINCVNGICSQEVCYSPDNCITNVCEGDQCTQRYNPNNPTGLCTDESCPSTTQFCDETSCKTTQVDCQNGVCNVISEECINGVCNTTTSQCTGDSCPTISTNLCNGPDCEYIQNGDTFNGNDSYGDIMNSAMNEKNGVSFNAGDDDWANSNGKGGDNESDFLDDYFNGVFDDENGDDAKGMTADDLFGIDDALSSAQDAFNGLTRDENGNLVDANGNVYHFDENGNLVDANGNVVHFDKDGNLIDENGNIVSNAEENGNGTLTDKDGNPLTVGPDGKLYDADGNEVDIYGNPVGSSAEQEFLDMLRRSMGGNGARNSALGPNGGAANNSLMGGNSFLSNLLGNDEQAIRNNTASDQELYNFAKKYLAQYGLSERDIFNGKSYSANSAWTEPESAWDFNRITTLVKKRKLKKPTNTQQQQPQGSAAERRRARERGTTPQQNQQQGNQAQTNQRQQK